MQVSKLRRVLASSLVVAAVGLGLAACQPPDDWYAATPSLSGRSNGDVLQTYVTNFGLNGAVTSTAVMYRSTDALGQPNRVTGTVLVPTAAWTGAGPRPIVSFAVGTQGVGDTCAPSKNMTTGLNYEQANIQALLDQGWAVAVTDYAGLGTPGIHTYVIKDDEGHAVIDIVRAAMRLPGSGIASNAPVGFYGYSQGGGAVAAAAELEASYAPELNVRGTAAGGVPADLAKVAANLNGPGNFYFAFLAFAALGLDQAYPELDLESYLNDTGRSLLEQAKASCIVDGLLLGAGRTIESLTTTNPLTTPQWQARIDQQRIGRVKPAAPVLQLHAGSDEIVPYGQGQTLRDDWCARGARVRFVAVAGQTHLGAMGALGTEGIPFLRSLLTGQAVTTTCN